ncbi:hypothetical protein QTA56_16595 [Acinetobacter sp. VNH17]|uniref:Uncharacterized protein n=1 Tax=Acinetobacter thutiue TaxID=2998078 RepID=A0ABT7WT16_9GAMM|nr:hypothetical protein [Acinetobacter thutiue]MCY6413727.1 hypothetical protein [Acinetobacter thutiue]MDN0015836.1 hypothetical protein [Acinetobacter thutiue]
MSIMPKHIHHFLHLILVICIVILIDKGDEQWFGGYNQDRAKKKFYRLSEKADIYYVGVKESGQMEDEQRALYDECMRINQGYHHAKCYSYVYSRKHKDFQKSGTVTVNVNVQTPIILILNSYEAVKWHIKDKDEQVKLIYLTGNIESEIFGEIEDNKIYSSFPYTQKCSNCTVSNLENFSYSQDETKNQIKIIDQFGKSAASFRIESRIRELYID